MRVLMFGWEFPPHKSGGLGTACYDLTKGLAQLGAEVTFVMPSAPKDVNGEFIKLIGVNNFSRIKLKRVSSLITPYQSSGEYSQVLHSFRASGGEKELYGQDIYAEVYRYGLVASEIADEEPHDVIHVHDWMTYQAGINAKNVSGKPLIAHIHATEFDRTGGNPNTLISQLEYEGLSAAEVIIANSEYTRQNVIKAYKINPDKIKVVHWGIDPDNNYDLNFQNPFKEKVVLFLGRVTIQKGPEYFIYAAKKVLEHYPNTKFVFAGSGDLFERMVSLTSDLGILDKFNFTGFLKGDDVHRAFQMADVYVMPSVSEPFGLVALEALKNNTPIIISKQSGVSEVLSHVFKVDFWDVDMMANQIVCLLKYPELYQELKQNGYLEAQGFNLKKPAQRCIDIYNEVISW